MFRVLAAFFFAACAPEPMPCEGGLTMRLEPNGTVDVAEISRRVAAYWTFMGCPVEVAEDAEIVVRWDAEVWTEEGRLGRTVDHREVTLAPFADYNGDECYTAMIATELAHEIGHVFGWGHSPRPEAMMYPRLAWCENKTSPPAAIF